MRVPGSAALWALLLAVLAGCATCREQELPAVLLRRLLHDEPNRMLQLLGKVGHTPACLLSWSWSRLLIIELLTPLNHLPRRSATVRTPCRGPS